MKLKWWFLVGIIVSFWGISALLAGEIGLAIFFLILAAVIITTKGIERIPKPIDTWKFMLIGNKNDDMQAGMCYLTPGSKIDYDWDPSTDKFIAHDQSGAVIGYFPSQANKYLELSYPATIDTVGADSNKRITVIAMVKKP